MPTIATGSFSPLTDEEDMITIANCCLELLLKVFLVLLILYRNRHEYLD